MSEAVKIQAEGVCDEIVEKNGWTQFSVNVGSQYPIRVSTKLPALIDQGRAAGQQRAVWTYTESQGGENPNKPGTYYTNRRLEGVEVGGTADPAAAPSSTPSGAKTGGSRSPSTDRSIERQVILKEMVSHFPRLDMLTEPEWWSLMAKLDDFMVNGIQPAVDERGVLADDIPFG